MGRILALAALGLTVAPSTIAAPRQGPASNATAVVDSFHSALAKGDTKAAARLFTDDALIFEEGGAEHSKAEYAAHHLPADAEFSKSVRSTVTRRSGHSDGTFAWIASEGRTTGAFRGKKLDQVTTETVVLRRAGQNWKIVHIHWSSRTAR